MVSTDPLKAEPDTPAQPRVLTPSEIASLRQEMKQAVAWMQAELSRRRSASGKPKHQCVDETKVSGERCLDDVPSKL